MSRPSRHRRSRVPEGLEKSALLPFGLQAVLQQEHPDHLCAAVALINRATLRAPLAYRRGVAGRGAPMLQQSRRGQGSGHGSPGFRPAMPTPCRPAGAASPTTADAGPSRRGAVAFAPDHAGRGGAQLALWHGEIDQSHAACPSRALTVRPPSISCNAARSPEQARAAHGAAVPGKNAEPDLREAQPRRCVVDTTR